MSRVLAVALFVTLSVLWGLSFPVISVGLETLPPLLFAAFRYDVAAVLLLTYAGIRVDSWYPTGRNNVAAVAGGGIFLVGGTGFLFVGQQTVPAAVAAILQGLLPIATAVWARPLLGERISLVGTIGVGIGFLGVGLVVQPTPSTLYAGDAAGRMIVLGQVISVALGGVLIQRADPSMDRVALTGWSMFLGAIVLHAVSLGAGERFGDIAATPITFGAVIYLGVFATAVGFFIYFTIIDEQGAFEASLVNYAVPVVATLVGVFVLGETISWVTVVGFGLVAAGFVTLKRRAIADTLGVSAPIVRP